MESIYTTRDLLTPGVFMVSLDLRDTYLHVLIRKESRQFLRFAMKKAFKTLYFQFNALPFGLASAPHIFTKILSEAPWILRSEGIHIIPYLDDLLIVADSADEVKQNLSRTIRHLQQLGWLVNQETSQLVPTQSIVFLGYLIDSTTSKIFLTKEKVAKIVAEVSSLCVCTETSIQGIIRGFDGQQPSQESSGHNSILKHFRRSFLSGMQGRNLFRG